MRGVPVEGVGLYPVLDHPGWGDDRYCPNGLPTHGPSAADRVAEPALAAVIARRRRVFGSRAIYNRCSILIGMRRRRRPVA